MRRRRQLRRGRGSRSRGRGRSRSNSRDRSRSCGERVSHSRWRLRRHHDGLHNTREPHEPGPGPRHRQRQGCADSRCRIPDNANASLCAQSNSTAGNQKTGGERRHAKGKLINHERSKIRSGKVRSGSKNGRLGPWGGSHRAQGHGAPLKRAGGAVESALDGSGQIGPLKAPRLEGKTLDSAVRGGGVPPSAKRR